MGSTWNDLGRVVRPQTGSERQGFEAITNPATSLARFVGTVAADDREREACEAVTILGNADKLCLDMGITRKGYGPRIRRRAGLTLMLSGMRCFTVDDSWFGRGERETRIVTKITKLFRDTVGQDVVEYTLLMAFLVLAAAGLFVASGNSVKGIWGTAGSQLELADGGSSADTTATSDPGAGSGSSGSGGQSGSNGSSGTKGGHHGGHGGGGGHHWGWGR